MNNGWIKLHRKFRDNPFYTNPNAIALWIECLMRAGHEDRTFYWKRERVVLDKGMFLFGEEELGAMFKLSRQTARYWMEQFVVDSMLDIKKTSKGSIGTVRKWSEYQSLDIPLDNEKTTKRQRKDTKKKVKKEKKVKNIVTTNVVTSEGKQLNETIKLFEPLNPSYERLYSNKTQRAALERLTKKLGKDKLEGAISFLVENAGDRFIPVITTPVQLENKLGNLISFATKKNSKGSKTIVIE